MCVQCFQRQEERVRSPENGGTSGYELPCLCWELKLALLKTHQVLITTKPSPQPPTLDILTIEMKMFILQTVLWEVRTVTQPSFLFSTANEDWWRLYGELTAI